MSADPPPDADRWARVANAFDAVVDLAPGDRAEALDRLCRTGAGGPDPALRAEVEAMLDADAQAQTSADALHLPDAAALVGGAARAGERVGPWRVLRPLGRGGMGRVDLVERADGAYEQRAALKRLSLVAPSRLRRFLRERQILARLQHPGIARLLDGGVDRGEPYLVMEYVHGQPLTEHADARGLGLRQRLELFLQVCDAVAYAHRHLVVHRDLKPSNVLVASGEAGDGGSGTEDGQEAAPGASPEASGGTRPQTPTHTSRAAGARVKLLDFGVARLLDAGVEDAITQEAAGAPLTPGYAAPEQLRGGAVTTATDVWALGVLLYELIAGRRPFGGSTREAWVEAVLRAEPTAPSRVALTRSPPPPPATDPPEASGAEAAPSNGAASGASGAEPSTAPLSARDARRLRGDLDAICLQALRGEPDERYASAHDLGADLRRFLASEPVAARRPSPLYRARRFARRNRAAVGVAALLVLALAGGAVATLWQAREARAEAARSEATATFLTGLFEAADPAVASGDTLTALGLLDAGARRIHLQLASEPGLRADLYHTIGVAYRGLGQNDSSRAFAQRMLAVRGPGGEAPSPPEAIRARILAAEALRATDPAAAAEEIEGLVAEARALGDRRVLLEALETQAISASSRTPEANAATLDEALALARAIYGDGSPRVGQILYYLATVAPGAGRHGDAEALLRDALARQGSRRDPAGRAITLDRLAPILAYSGKPQEAVAVADEALGLVRTLYGPSGHRLARAYATRALAHNAAQDLAAAERDARRSVALAEAAGSPQVLYDGLKSLAFTLTKLGRTTEAIGIHMRTLDIAHEAFGPRSPITASTYRGLAGALSKAGRHAEAADAWDRLIASQAEAFGAGSAVVVASLLDAARGAAEGGLDARAERLFRRAAALAQGLPESSRTRAYAPLALGRFLLDAGRAPEATGPLREAVRGRAALAKPDIRPRPGARSDGDRAAALLGEALLASGGLTPGEAAEARRLLAQAAAALADSLGADAPEAARAREALGRAGR